MSFHVLTVTVREGLRLDELTLSPTAVKEGAELWDLWKKTTATTPHLEQVSIALVGKYTSLPDSKHLPAIWFEESD